MVKRKKGKGSKLARMSDEERARYMQHRAEFELETRRRKQQLIAIFTKNKLIREELFSKLNSAKINEKWRYVLRQIKCKELREDVTHLCTSFNRVMRTKDATISYLYKGLEIADKDHRKLQENHIVLINNIIGKYRQRLKELQDMHTIDNVMLNNIFELSEIKNNTQRSCKEISNFMLRRKRLLEEIHSARKTQNAVNIFSILYMEKNMASDLVQRSFLKIHTIWHQLCKILNKYEDMIGDKKEQHDRLKEQDNVYQICMSQYPKEHSQLQNVIQSLRDSIEILTLKRNERIAKLRKNDASLREKFKNIKHEFAVTRMMNRLQLRQLTVLSNEALKNFQRIVDKGAMILALIKTCTNLEPLFSLRKYFIQNTVKTELVESNIPDFCNKANEFWKHYNNMRANNVLLKKESNKLCREHKMLKHKLQTFLTLDFGILALYPVASPST